VVAVALAGAVGATFGVRALFHHVTPPPPTCQLGSGPTALVLDPEQASNAATIAAVAKRMGLPNHAVTIALATSLQESKLRNLPYGDRDSLGLFQQRPSQGWGTPAQLLTPAFAAAAFYDHLRRISGWQTLPVAEAAQDVQHSADGSAYAAWEEAARALARALTGEVVAVFGCRYPSAQEPQRARLVSLARRELGRGALTRHGSTRQDWLVAQWLVAHAYSYGVVDVTVRGRRWTHDSLAWKPDARAGVAPTFVMAPSRSRS